MLRQSICRRVVEEQCRWQVNVEGLAQLYGELCSSQGIHPELHQRCLRVQSGSTLGAGIDAQQTRHMLHDLGRDHCTLIVSWRRTRQYAWLRPTPDVAGSAIAATVATVATTTTTTATGIFPRST